MKKSELTVLFLSFLSSVAILLAERTIGIGWDYHPDSVYYASNSATMVEALRDQGIARYFNNGYYVLCWLLGQNVILITVLNMTLFSVTNVLLYRAHQRYAIPLTSVHGFAIWLLLLNPYRLHLSTTLLKDTVLIFLAVLCTSSLLRFLKMAVLLAFFRLAAVLYGARHVRGRYLIVACVVVLTTIFLFPAATLEVILAANELEMVFRDFDSVPTFQEWGLAGSLVRAVVWPLFAISGVFVILSPSIMYVPVAVGSWFTLLYSAIVLRTIRVPLGVFGALFTFGILAPGFTAYIRYVYPLLTIWPLALLYESARDASVVRDRTPGRLSSFTAAVRVLQRAQATDPPQRARSWTE